jgi:glycosyltransferase involved in cell wall biosynthesis
VSIRLSILIPTLPERLTPLGPTVQSLTNQATGKDVEVLVLLDNRRRSTGAKRNALMDIARGDFVAFVDDDDRVTPDYVERLYQALVAHPAADCIVFDVLVDHRGKFTKVARYGVEYRDREDRSFYYRKPYSPRSAYAGAAELSVYVHRDRRGQGIGQALLSALEDVARQRHFYRIRA